MDTINKWLFGVGIALALLAGLGTYAAVTGAQGIGRATTAVVVARKEIPERTLFTGGNVGALLSTAQVPTDLVPEGALLQANEAVGKVTTTRLAANEVVRGGPDRLASSEGTTARPAAAIPRDKVALAMPATDTISVAGAVQPGDRVDVLATLARPNSEAVTQSIFQDVQVFAVGRWQSDGQPRPAAANPASTVTLLLDYQQALVLENLQQTGARVSLALRRLDQTGAVPTEPVTPDSVAAQWMRLGGNVSAR
jgi:pilus assembly protein CpaB